MGKTVALHNLGCKVNAYETEVMTKQLEEAGYKIVNFNEKADVYIINTCSVTNIADRKSRQMLHRAKKLNKDACVVAAGCYVQGAREEMEKDAAVDVIVSNNCKSQIVDIIDKYFEGKNEIEKVDIDNSRDVNEKLDDKVDYNIKSCKEYFIDINKTSEYEDMTLTDTGEKTRAYMKIQDGCNQFCSYCIIPFVRGRIRSRSIESIVKEAEGLALRGYKEIVLTGIHISSYGKDYVKNKHDETTENSEYTSEGIESAQKDEDDYLSSSQESDEFIKKDEKSGLGLIDVVEAICKVDGIKRLRLGSLEPRIITDDFVQRLVKQTKVCPHFHLSLQSGCDETLSRMNRHYTCDEYEESCNILRKYYDDPAISTDVIVGFPGETDEEFKTTHEFLNEIAFAKMHIFKYSRRKGTRADKMPNQIPDTIKQERSEDLLGLEKKLASDYINRNLGKEEYILLEEVIDVAGKEYMTGYTSTYVKIAIPIEDGKVYGIDVEDANGKIIKVKLERELESELVLVSPIEWME